MKNLHDLSQLAVLTAGIEASIDADDLSALTECVKNIVNSCETLGESQAALGTIERATDDVISRKRKIIWKLKGQIISLSHFHSRALTAAKHKALQRFSPESEAAVLGTPVDKIDFPGVSDQSRSRIINALLNDGVSTLEQLWNKSEIDILRLPNMGKISFKAIQDSLFRHGMALGGVKVRNGVKA